MKKPLAIIWQNSQNLCARVLENSRKTLITIQDEIEALENYLNLEQLSNEDNFDYEIIVDENIQTDAYGIPPLILQPFAENSIVHGLKELNHRGKITVNFDMERNIYRVLCSRQWTRKTCRQRSETPKIQLP